MQDEKNELVIERESEGNCHNAVSILVSEELHDITASDESCVSSHVS